MTIDEIRDDSLFTGREVKALLREHAAPPEFISTVEASRRFGRSNEWWRKRAAGIPGARQDGPGSPWLLPYGECERIIGAVGKDDVGAKRKERRRGAYGRGPRPRKEASSA
jgi:hypothetical protein